MRIAMVLSDLCVPPRSGLQEQSLLLLEGLVAAGVEVDLFAFSGTRGAVGEAMLPAKLAAPPMPTRAGWTFTGLMTRLLGRSGLEQRLGEYDVVYLEGAAAAGLLRRGWAARAVVNLIDPGSRRRLRFAATASGSLRKAKEWLLAGLSYLLEAALNDKRATWVVVSDSDRDYLRRVHGHAATEAIPVMLPELPAPTLHSPSGAVVVAVYADLRQAHMWRAFVALAEEVLRPVCAAEPALRITVLGRLLPSPELLAALPQLPMTFSGWSEDHLGELQRADIVLLPDTVGTGLKNRAVQCLGLGCATVGTPVAFEAIPVTSGQEAYVAATPEKMVEAVLTLARTPSLRAEVGNKAREFAAARYGREQVMKTWLSLLHSLERRDERP